MVQKQTRRRSSLIMGAMLALLLGIAAGFLVLALPVRMVEAVTTFTRLAKLMIQAEPPISPSDQSLLAVLAGILTAGIGWVLVDWILFGRAGMRTLIREREDDYEDEDGDAFRPTDPLDLVVPATLPTGDWASQQAGDTRRPLSARTDIGDPPRPIAPPGLQPAPMSGIDQLLPPIDQILPGAAVNPFAPTAPIRPASPPDPFQQSAGQDQTSTIFGGPSLAIPQAPVEPAWQPPQAPAPATPEPRASTSVWLPTPGVRPDGSMSQTDFGTSADDGEDDAGLSASPFAPRPAAPQPFIQPDSFNPSTPPLELNTPEPPPLFTAPVTIVPIPASIAPPVFQPAAPPPLAFEPPAAPFAEPPAFAPPAYEAQAFTPPVPPAVEAPVQPVAPPPAPRRAPADSLFAGMDKNRLEDLLVRLERGLEARRARARAAAQPPAPAAAPQPAIMPQPPFPEPAPTAAPHVAPLVSAESPPISFDPPQRVVPPAGFAAPMQPTPQPVSPTTAPVYDLPAMPASPAYDLSLQQPASASPIAFEGASSDELLDQPLHITLDLLRNRVKR